MSGLSAIRNVWSAALLQAKNEDRVRVCANVSVNKGEGVVNGKNTLIAA
jgi:hypothetical protein